MTKSEMLANWKKTSALKQEFSKTLGERYPHLCYTSPDLLKKVNETLQALTAELAKVKDGEPEAAVKAKKEEAKPEAEAKTETKVATHEVKVGQKIGAKPAVKANA